MAKKKIKSVRDALLYVERNPDWPPDEERLDMPVWEMVARNLFEFTISGDNRVVGSVGRANRASRIIMDRLTGTRRAGSAPATKVSTKITFKNLSGELEAPEEPTREASI